ncbi:hypothetical protein KY284_029000 [Solanum tuberosum]|nr:hypothetical protein KY284_029000 [Solanum tuberosum]
MMLAFLSHVYFWPKMEDDIEAYVKTFHVCQVGKTECKKEFGLLQPLPIPERPWLSVSMDFISGFPKVDGMASIMVMDDRFLKYSIFIVAPNLCSSEIAVELFYKYVVKYFGVPADIVSDRDTRFTGMFWTTLFNMIGTELKFSTVNHPQTVLLQSAQVVCDRDEPFPFEIVLGKQLMTPLDAAKTKNQGKCPAVYMVARDRLEMFFEAQDSLRKAQRRMKKYTDEHRRSVEFSVDADDPDRNRSKRAPLSIPTKVDVEIQKIPVHQVVGTSKKNTKNGFLIHWKSKSAADVVWEKAKYLWQFDDQISDYLETISMRTSSSNSAGAMQLRVSEQQRVQDAWVLARQLGRTRLTCGQSHRHEKAVCFLDKARLWT